MTPAARAALADALRMLHHGRRCPPWSTVREQDQVAWLHQADFVAQVLGERGYTIRQASEALR